jgi:1,4-alpha-glucan branching enzyme
VLQYPFHAGMQMWVSQLNRLHRDEPALHELDIDPAGFEWVDANDHMGSTISILRKGRAENERVLVVFNFTPVPREGYKVGVPTGGYWRELLNSDGKEYAGSGVGNSGGVEAKAEPVHGRPFSLNLTLPPLGALFLKGPA